MSTSTDRLVVVPAALLDDVLELARLAADRLPNPDPLRAALTGSTAAVRSAIIVEP